MPAIAAASVVLFFGGLFAIVSGWNGWAPVRPRRSAPSRQLDREQLRRLAVAFGAGVAALVVSGWLGLAVAVAVVTFAMLGLYSDRARRMVRRRRVQAVASWLEMIRDTIASGAGFGSAVRLTAGRAPRPIAAEVRRLSVRLDSMSFSEAIARFGDEVGVAEADTAIVALATAARSASGNLVRVLTVAVDALRNRVEQASRIEALRSRFLTAASLMVAATVASSAMVLLSSAQFRRPYDSVVGQLVLMTVGGFFFVAVTVLRRMGTESAAVRVALEDAR